MMKPIDKLRERLQEIIALEGTKSAETLSSYITGEILGDYEEVYGDLYENDPVVQKIADLAGDVEMSNGTNEELNQMWLEIKHLTDELQYHA